MHLKNIRRAYEGEIELGISKLFEQFWDQDTF